MMTNRCKEIEIGEISEHIRNGLSVKQSKKKNGLPITRIETIWNELIDLDRVGYSGIKADEKEDWLLKSGDILISHINSKTHLGKCAIYEGFPNKLIHGMNLLCLRPNTQKVVPNYLIRVLQSRQFKSKIPSITKDSVNQSSFNVKNFRRLTIPLPSLAEQKRIAAILDKADAIRCKRRKAIQLADEFLRSVFLDMFGDPVTNKRGWERCKLEEVLENIHSGWSPKCYNRAANPDEWGVLKLGAVTSCRYIAQENKALPLDLGPREDIEVKKWDLLFTRKNTYQLVAASAFVYETRPKLMLSDTIFRFNFKRNAAILPEYVLALLTHPGKRKDLQKLAGGSAGSMPNISKSRLMKQLIELPPIEFQQNFRNVFYRVRSCIDSQTNAHNLATEFFNSLSQRAFRGEL